MILRIVTVWVCLEDGESFDGRHSHGVNEQVHRVRYIGLGTCLVHRCAQERRTVRAGWAVVGHTAGGRPIMSEVTVAAVAGSGPLSDIARSGSRGYSNTGHHVASSLRGL